MRVSAKSLVTLAFLLLLTPALAFAQAGGASLAGTVKDASGALHIDDRRLTGHRDGFLERANLHVDWDGQRNGARQFESLPLVGIEARQSGG